MKVSRALCKRNPVYCVKPSIHWAYISLWDGHKCSFRPSGVEDVSRSSADSLSGSRDNLGTVEELGNVVRWRLEADEDKDLNNFAISQMHIRERIAKSV